MALKNFIILTPSVQSSKPNADFDRFDLTKTKSNNLVDIKEIKDVNKDVNKEVKKEVKKDDKKEDKDKNDDSKDVKTTENKSKIKELLEYKKAKSIKSSPRKELKASVASPRKGLKELKDSVASPKKEVKEVKESPLKDPKEFSLFIKSPYFTNEDS